jgi:hypothetical protein
MAYIPLLERLALPMETFGLSAPTTLGWGQNASSVRFAKKLLIEILTLRPMRIYSFIQATSTLE